jgi:hypothetical protein
MKRAVVKKAKQHADPRSRDSSPRGILADKPFIEFAPAEVYGSPLRCELQSVGFPMKNGTIALIGMGLSAVFSLLGVTSLDPDPQQEVVWCFSLALGSLGQKQEDRYGAA